MLRPTKEPLDTSFAFATFDGHMCVDKNELMIRTLSCQDFRAITGEEKGSELALMSYGVADVDPICFVQGQVQGSLMRLKYNFRC